MSVTYLIGDTREQVATIPDGSVSLVACSPPFIALRSYLPADHPMKHAEIGSEPDPATFIDTLLALTAEWGRVLAPWGSIAIELGDTYAGSPGKAQDAPQDEGGGYRSSERVLRDGYASGIRNMNNKHQGGGAGWPRPKCLALVPQAYALSLAYGRNVLNGNPSPAGQWLVRNMIVWHRPNPAVGALGDKFRPSTSYITVATRSAKRWFDLTAVRQVNNADRMTEGHFGVSEFDRKGTGRSATQAVGYNPAGAPPLDAWFDEHDTWTLTTQPSSLAHYAMWPAKLAERLVLSMCPEWVCGKCGEPRRRVERKTPGYAAVRDLDPRTDWGDDEHGERIKTPSGPSGFCASYETLGWTDCGHDNYRPGVVLDPFAGTGTTLAVADLHGRDAIGIDIDERNHALYPARLTEVRKALHGVKPQAPGQLDLFGGAA